MFFFGDGGLPPAETKRAKSTEKTYLSDARALVNRRLVCVPCGTGCSAWFIINRKPGRVKKRSRALIASVQIFHYIVAGVRADE